MPTNDERREVAEILRSGVGTTDYLSDDDFIDWVHGVVSRSRDGHILDRLADFIEPEERTCRVIMKWDGLDGRDPVCSKCGAYFDDKKWHEQKFCPNCGARVIPNE